jgi:saccharopepsin
MAPTAPFLLFVLAATLTAAAPTAAPGASNPLKFDVTRNKFGAKGVRLVDADRARVEAIKSRFQDGPASQSGSSFSFPITNAAVTYTASVGIGSPPSYYTLLIDTGSSNTWV